MGLPSGYPTYTSGNTHHPSLAMPGPESGMSKSVGKGGSSALMIPNSNFLVSFIGGDIGIAEPMLKSTIFKNLNSPAASSDEMVFRSFANTNKIDTTEATKDGKKIKMPKDKIKLSPENDMSGLKALEKMTLFCIFETQKPYMEIAKFVIGNLAKSEDVLARVMPLLSPSPLTAKSEKPKGNSKAISYQGGAELKKELSKLEAIRKKGGQIKLGKNGEVTKLPVNNSNSNTNGQNDGQDGTGNGYNDSETYTGKWKIISTVYSTGIFDKDVADCFTTSVDCFRRETGSGNFNAFKRSAVRSA